jgi:hypothetical protein
MFGTTCPVDLREQKWIEESMAWFRTKFGEGPLRQNVVLPTPDFFPGPYSGTAADIKPLVERICEYAAVDANMISTELYGDSAEADLARVSGLTYRSASIAGHYRKEAGRAIIGIDQTLVSTPERLIATIAHELGHVRLDGHGGDRADHEPLTDLLTVYLGMGIFTANASFDYRRDNWRQSTRRLGYLTEPMFGYGLACYAWLRDERQPPWATFLDTNPRAFLKRGLRYLADNGPTTSSFE